MARVQRGAQMVFDRSVFDEPESLDASAPVKAYKVAPTFVIDLTVSALYLIAVLPTWRAAIPLGPAVEAPSVALGLVIVVCYVSKVWTVSHLDRRGGDARAYVKSSALVTDGPYGWSRHPTYTIAMLQFLLWSALALYLQAFTPWNPILLAAAVGLPLAFFLINDRIVMPVEEAMLRRLHPQEFDAYALTVRRWFGRRAADQTSP
ncbi:MAG: methyltransferase family protein [Roseiarcus sp.]